MILFHKMFDWFSDPAFPPQRVSGPQKWVNWTENQVFLLILPCVYCVIRK